MNDDASVFVELLCDHPGCALKDRRVLNTAGDVVEARAMTVGGQVRCPVHGVRADPIIIGCAGRLDW
ncbi:MAG TPA: hypothetical protein VF765_25375 [Polyangiaceae bacterium]